MSALSTFMSDWISVGYLLSAVLFIMGLKKLGHPRTAPRGNQLGALGMFVAVIVTVASMQLEGGAQWTLIIAGMVIGCLLYTSPSPRDQRGSRMPSSA